MARVTERTVEVISTRENRHSPDENAGELTMWVDVRITFPAAEDGSGRPMDLRNLKRAVEAFEQAGVDPSMSIEIERTDRGFVLATGEGNPPLTGVNKGLTSLC